MSKKYGYVYFEAEIHCPQCGRKVSRLSPDKDKAISAGTGFMCVACNMLIQAMLISPTRADELRNEAVDAGQGMASHTEDSVESDSSLTVGA